MSALEWLDAARADLDVIERPWSFEPASAGWTLEDAKHVFGIVSNVNSAVLIASAPERLDRMEKALRGVMEMPVPDGRHRADLRFVYAAALDDVRATIQEELGDE